MSLLLTASLMITVMAYEAYSAEATHLHPEKSFDEPWYAPLGHVQSPELRAKGQPVDEGIK